MCGLFNLFLQLYNKLRWLIFTGGNSWMKQWGILSIVSILFIFVWGIVIFQLVGANTKPKIGQDVAKIERTPYTKLGDGLIINWDNDTIVHLVENKSKNNIVLDLRLIDFSDVSTKEGVSIEDILSRLGLEHEF